MKQSIQLRLGQNLTMTPQLQQAIRLLQLSSLELSSEIQEALESNPMLEVAEGESEDGQNDPQSENINEKEKPSADQNNEQIPKKTQEDKKEVQNQTGEKSSDQTSKTEEKSNEVGQKEENDLFLENLQRLQNGEDFSDLAPDTPTTE